MVPISCWDGDDAAASDLGRAGNGSQHFKFSNDAEKGELARDDFSCSGETCKGCVVMPPIKHCYLGVSLWYLQCAHVNLQQRKYTRSNGPQSSHGV